MSDKICYTPQQPQLDLNKPVNTDEVNLCIQKINSKKIMNIPLLSMHDDDFNIQSKFEKIPTDGSPESSEFSELDDDTSYSKIDCNIGCLTCKSSSSCDCQRKKQELYKSYNSFQIPIVSNVESNCPNCPICKTPAITICDCEFEESTCANDHSWYFKNGKIYSGTRHDEDEDEDLSIASNMYSKTCHVCKTFPISKCDSEVDNFKCMNGHSWYYKYNQLERTEMNEIKEKNKISKLLENSLSGVCDTKIIDRVNTKDVLENDNYANGSDLNKIHFPEYLETLKDSIYESECYTKDEVVEYNKYIDVITKYIESDNKNIDKLLYVLNKETYYNNIKNQIIIDDLYNTVCESIKEPVVESVTKHIPKQVNTRYITTSVLIKVGYFLTGLAIGLMF